MLPWLGQGAGGSRKGAYLGHAEDVVSVAKVQSWVMTYELDVFKYGGLLSQRSPTF